MKKIYILSLLATIFPFAVLAAEVEKYEVVAERLEKSRANLSPKTGSSSYHFSQEAIENLPLGQATSLNQTLLRAPNVTQDSYGQIHIRGDHSNMQYRINNVIIPESLGSFGQMLDVRFVESFDLITGAMPAQFGQKTGAVIDIKTKDGAFKDGGRSEILTGSHDTFGLAQEIGGAKNRLNYYVNASYLKNNHGVESPITARDVSNNDTNQNKFFGYFSYLLANETKLTFMLANAQNHFRLPNNPDAVAKYDLSGASNVSPIGLKQQQKETNQYAILALQGVVNEDVDYQISTFTRYSKLDYDSDFVGDLIFNGVASDIDRNSIATGLQGDFSYKLNSENILRAGFVAANEVVVNKNRNAVFTIDGGGNQTSADPITISENGKNSAQNYGIYLQDEFSASEKLTLNYGVRFDAVRSYSNEHQYSPRFGAVYNLSKKTKFHAGYAKYFTPPSNELVTSNTVGLYSGTTNEGETTQNDIVKSESTNYYDIGVKHRLSDTANVGLDAFYKDIKNMLDRGQFGKTLIYSPFNFEKGRVYGVEFTSDYKKDNLSAYLNAAWQRAMASHINSGQHLHEADELTFLQNNYGNLDHEQQISAATGLTYKQGKTLYSADLIYGGGLRHGFANSNKLKYYTITNLGIEQQLQAPIIDKFKMRFTILNLFDRTYKLRDGSGIGVNSAQYGLRRSYYLTFSKEF